MASDTVYRMEAVVERPGMGSQRISDVVARTGRLDNAVLVDSKTGTWFQPGLLMHLTQC